MKLYNSIGPNAKVDIRAGQPINPNLANIGGWYARMKAHPSAAA
jgi:hypothetical protein